MSNYNYTPDKWVMLKFTHGGQDVYKILASFYGGYLDGDSWKLNSGVTKVEEDDKYYYFMVPVAASMRVTRKHTV